MEPYQVEQTKGGAGTTGASACTSTTTSTNRIGGLPRPQSSLELLSQTAAVMEHSPNPSASSNSIISLNRLLSAGSSPKEGVLRGVTPTDSFMAQQQKRVLSIPDMSKNSSKQRQPVMLEQKRSFLPASLLGETSEGSNEGGTPLYYSPGLFLSYSNGSTGGGNTNAGVQSSSNLQGPVPNGTGSSTHPPVAAATSSGSEGDAVPNFLTSRGSFASSGSLASAPSFAFPAPGTNTHQHTMQPTAFAPAPLQHLSHQQVNSSFVATTEGDVANHENFLLRQQLAAKDAFINSLQRQVETLQREIGELRQLPTGKISQIPVEYVLFVCFLYSVVQSSISRVNNSSYSFITETCCP